MTDGIHEVNLMVARVFDWLVREFEQTRTHANLSHAIDGSRSRRL